MTSSPQIDHSREQTVEVCGGNIVYEIIGAEGDFIVLTPGGRFGKDIPGLRPLADALAAGGYRVLLWDRPNCGKSDIQLFGESESHMRAIVLNALITTLGIGPCILAGGSGGARDSMLTAIRYPQQVTRLVLWNIVGGIFGTFVLGHVYAMPSILAVRGRGMAGVLDVKDWRDCIAANPANRDRLLAFTADEFGNIMLRWLGAFITKPGQTIPGVDDTLFTDLAVPTLIIRGGENDLNHPKRTSLEVQCLITGSELIDPPWPEDAWERASEAMAQGKSPRFNLFDTWVQAAPSILEFLGRHNT